MCDTTDNLLARGYQVRREHRLSDAKSLFGEAIDRSRIANDEVLLARSLIGLGQIERDLHDLDAALKHYEDAVRIYRTLDDPLGLAHTIRHLGDILRNRGELGPAAPCYEEALRIYRKRENTPPLDMANAIRGYALLKGEAGDTQAAVLLWREAGALYAQVGVEAGVAESDAQIARMTGA
jgi:tetratricopeptide (TPR) repeat protein